ncbi:acetylcholine receptor subunit alpha-type unc-38-like [Mytilus galloprovincialis]|uniref:acetylcholine receptor subunit alpha-type unc-38-like n=1 Tax=Mytilus galloprovincialis TaxID=29158 RepID=UPI003F7B8691
MYIDAPVSFIFLLGILSSGNSQTLSDMKQLYSDIFVNHQKSLIPNSDFSSPLEIQLQFHLMTITQFREVEETLQIAGGVSAFWKDGEFSWTPSSYGNAEYVIVPQTTVWTPKLVLLNSVGTLKPMGLGNELSVTIDYNGSMAVSFGEVLSSKCSTNIYKFPFDSQTCELEFAAWGVYARDILLKGVSNPIDLSFFTPNSDWELVSNILTTHPSTGYSIFEIELTLKRSPLYYTVIVICPFILFSILNPLVFLLPVEAGERIGLALTVLLSYTIFLSMVQTSIPAASNPMSLLLIIMVATILLSGIIAVVTIYISSLYYNEESAKMNFLLKFIGQKWHRGNTITQVMPLCNDAEKDNVNCKTEIFITWKDVCNGLDNIMMVIAYSATVILICAYFITISL